MKPNLKAIHEKGVKVTEVIRTWKLMGRGGKLLLGVRYSKTPGGGSVCNIVTVF